MVDLFDPDDETFDLTSAAEAHCDLFNASVRSGDWAPFLATFADDAQMLFTNVPVPPAQGRDAIAAAYSANPPTDTMNVVSIEPVDRDTARVRFGWDAGGDGTMVVQWGDGLVSVLEITFD
jgi:hypothetical protein